MLQSIKKPAILAGAPLAYIKGWVAFWVGPVGAWTSIPEMAV